MSFLRGSKSSSSANGSEPNATPEDRRAERQHKAELRAERMDLARQARKATSGMQPPEPVRGIYVCAFLVAVGLVSYFSTDWVQTTKKIHGKVTYTHGYETRPEVAILLIVMALIAVSSIYWRRRYVTGILLMLGAAMSVGTPLPKNLSDATYLGFLVPAGYVLWMLIFRMNKEQKAWLDKNRPARAVATNVSRGGSRASQAQRKQAAQARSRKDRTTKPATTATGRPLPAGSGRYTPPRANTRPGQRKS